MGEVLDMDHTNPAPSLWYTLQEYIANKKAEYRVQQQEKNERKKERDKIYQDAFRKEEDTRLLEKAKKDAEDKYTKKAGGEFSILGTPVSFNPNASFLGDTSGLKTMDGYSSSKKKGESK